MVLKFPSDPITAPSFIGIVVAISGNVLISFALNCQKLAHKRLEAERNALSHHSGNEVQDYGSGDTTLNGLENGPLPRSPSAGERGELSADSLTGSFLVRPMERNDTTGGFQIQAQPFPAPPSPHAKLRPSILTPKTKGLSLTHSPIVEEPAVASTVNGDANQQAQDQRKPGNVTWSEGVVWTIPQTASSTESSHPPSDAKSGDHQPNETDYLHSKLWWFGFMLLNVGELGNFLSYGFAPASVVAPLGTFALIANCFFAPLILKERFQKRDLIGVAIAIIGAVTVVGASKTSDVRLDPKGLLHAVTRIPFLVYTALCAAGAITLVILAESSLGRKYVFIDVGLCALFGGFTVLSTKGFSTLLSLEWMQIFKEWITYPLLLVLGGTGVGQIKYLNRALMKFDSKIVIPIQFVLFTLAAIVGSAVLYRDFDNISPYRFIVFLYGCATTFLGVFLLTWDSGGTSSQESTPSPSRPSSPTPPTSMTPLISPRSVRISNPPSLRGRSSTTSLGLSPAYLLLASSGSPSNLSGPLIAVPVRQRARSESRTRGLESSEWESARTAEQQARDSTPNVSHSLS